MSTNVYTIAEYITRWYKNDFIHYMKGKGRVKFKKNLVVLSTKNTKGKSVLKKKIA